MKLSTRLLVLLLPTMTIVMVAYLYWSMAEREDTLVSQAEQEMGAYGAALAVALRYAFHSNTHADFQRVINEVTRDPKIYAILVYDEGGNPLLVSDSVTTPSLAPPASLARVLATGKPVSFRRELEDRDVFSVLRPIYDQDGRISGALEVAQPLSFVQLQQQEMRKRFFFNTLTLLVVVTVLTLWLVRRLVAAPMQRFVGAVRALGQGELAHRIGPEDPVTGTMRGSELATLELEINTMAANLETARARIMREAEERVVLERRLRESEKMAAVGNLAAGLAHEIAAPLNVISGRAELLLKSESENPERHRNLGIIVRQIERITTIVRNLLDSGQRRLERQLGHVDAALVLDGVAEFLDGELSRNEIALTRLYPRPLLVFGDPDLLHQVFVNLVLNAVQGPEFLLPHCPICSKRSSRPRRRGQASDWSWRGALSKSSVERWKPPTSPMAVRSFASTCRRGVRRLPRSPARTVRASARTRVPRNLHVSDHVLVVEDDGELRDFLVEVLNTAGHVTTGYPTADAALRAVAEGARADVVVTDLIMPGMPGADLLRGLRQQRPELNVIVMTAFGSIDSAVELVRAGAYDYLTKPIATQELLLAVSHALDQSRLRREVARLGRSAMAAGLPGFLGASQPIQDLLGLVVRAAQSRHPVLITGESGTGKELVARAIHQASGRGAFVAVNCGALPEPLLESELFGHEKGAFSGADRAKPGLFEAADGGVLLLDEIGDLPLALQPKLLRALENGEVRRVGATEARNLDVRVIAATNRDLDAEVQGGRFREDLFYRLNVLHLHTPPLRERAADIPLLAEHFLQGDAAPSPRSRRISPDAMALLTTYPWPGNVRELRNAIQRAAVVATSDEVRPEDLPSRIREASRAAPLVRDSTDRALPLRDVERLYILEVLRQAGGNKSRAAELLGLDRKTLYRKLEEYRLDMESPAPR